MVLRLINSLNNYLIENAYDTVVDEEGIYIPDLNVDIICEDENYLVSSDMKDIIRTKSYEDILLYLNDLYNSDILEDELSKNNYYFEKETPRFFSIGNDKIKIIDGKFYLEDDNKNTTVFINIPSLVGALQSKFLGE